MLGGELVLSECGNPGEARVEVGEGRVFYSALGHCAEAYADENYRELLKQACLWLLDGES